MTEILRLPHTPNANFGNGFEESTGFSTQPMQGSCTSNDRTRTSNFASTRGIDQDRLLEIERFRNQSLNSTPRDGLEAREYRLSSDPHHSSCSVDRTFAQQLPVLQTTLPPSRPRVSPVNLQNYNPANSQVPANYNSYDQGTSGYNGQYAAQDHQQNYGQPASNSSMAITPYSQPNSQYYPQQQQQQPMVNYTPQGYNPPYQQSPSSLPPYHNQYYSQSIYYPPPPPPQPVYQQPVYYQQPPPPPMASYYPPSMVYYAQQPQMPMNQAPNITIYPSAPPQEHRQPTTVYPDPHQVRKDRKSKKTIIKEILVRPVEPSTAEVLRVVHSSVAAPLVQERQRDLKSTASILLDQIEMLAIAEEITSLERSVLEKMVLTDVDRVFRAVSQYLEYSILPHCLKFCLVVTELFSYLSSIGPLPPLTQTDRSPYHLRMMSLSLLQGISAQPRPSQQRPVERMIVPESNSQLVSIPVFNQIPMGSVIPSLFRYHGALMGFILKRTPTMKIFKKWNITFFSIKNSMITLYRSFQDWTNQGPIYFQVFIHPYQSISPIIRKGYLEGNLYTLKIQESDAPGSVNRPIVVTSQTKLKLVAKLATSNLEFLRVIRSDIIEQMELKRSELRNSR